jgi:hypothetical protein
VSTPGASATDIGVLTTTTLDGVAKTSAVEVTRLSASQITTSGWGDALVIDADD